MKAVKALIFDAQRNMLVLQRSGTHPVYAHEPDMPGGEVEQGESVEDALIREVAEETGLQISKQQLTYGGERTTSSDDHHILYIVNLKEEKPAITLSWEHESYLWRSFDALTRRLDSLKSKDEYVILAQQWLRHQSQSS